MNFLEERILKDGVVKEGNVLKVDSFLNHQMDVSLFNQIGAELAKRFEGKKITKILTIEASGIGIASIVALHFGSVPVVYAKKSKSINLDGDMYTAEVVSFTHQVTNNIIVSKKFLTEEDSVLIIDDFLANGCALQGLIQIVQAAGAKVAGIGIAIAVLEKKSDNVKTLHKALCGLQEVFFGMIKGLIWALPAGIVAFAAQLAAQMSAGVVVGSIGKYVLVVLGGNAIQFFVILPLFCYLRGVNGYKVMRQMSPVLLMALFTKSSAATLPVTVATAEANMKAKPWIARFILPLCCTINMNGCAAFILVTSLFVMKNSPECGIVLTLPVMLVWCLIATLCAIGNAGVPMGCYFLTLSLMAGVNGNLMILGVILPIYTIIDMIETAENVWSDCCICAIVDKDLGNSAICVP